MRYLIIIFCLTGYITHICLSFSDISVKYKVSENKFETVNINRIASSKLFEDKDYKINCEPIKQIWRSFINSVWHNQFIYAAEVFSFFDFELSNQWKLNFAPDAHPKPHKLSFWWYLGNTIGWIFHLILCSGFCISLASDD